MLSFIKNIFLPENEGNTKFIREDRKIEIATCALFIEAASADDEFLESERINIINSMTKIFNLEESYVEELLQIAVKKIEESISLYEFTDVVNRNFSQDGKFEIVKNIWKLILSDEKIHTHEDYIIRKISSCLNLYHSDLISAKLLAKQELGIQN